ncbi:hypothetical protein CAPTEDRAFT_205215 [Capitella teleta]|uniref:HECT domain-containing protein n=1 Tax=Capitella teleta TaxID=283909 RepID=R7UJQ5_CAPTE|nr:hypothetical protein CAPTEDRAFT_205215 [Capitella teleta]|eukprot:ELU06789.1 hypothetical protein CAPTEDRAFT_205215 [Capitella teleta]
MSYNPLQLMGYLCCWLSICFRFINGTSIMKTNPLMMYMLFRMLTLLRLSHLLNGQVKEMSVKLILHRGMVFEDLNEAVKVHGLECLLQKQPLHVQMLLPNGVNEAAEETGGVLRDALPEYWETFFTKCSSDGDVRVPVLCHDMKNTWSLCACVLVLGYQSQGYLPTRLAVAFLQHCLGQCPSPKNITEAFLKMIPQDERNVLNRGDFEDEDFIDFLATHDVRKTVNEGNWCEVLHEIAHKVVIQQPAYVADVWGPILRQHLDIHPDSLQDLMNSLQPTPKNILKILVFKDDSRSKPMSDYLKSFVKHSSEERCQRFLRFCTGSDAVVCSELHVKVVDYSSEFARQPVAHICGFLLELPNCSSYAEFSEEFSNVLKSGIWVMDIV